jgi:hypothetical protein
MATNRREENTPQRGPKLRRPPAQFTIRRMMIVVVVIAVPLAIVTWIIRFINGINQSLHEFYGPEGTRRRMQEYQDMAKSQAGSK